MKRMTMAAIRWILGRWGLVVCSENELRESRRMMERIARQWIHSGNANDGIKDNTPLVVNTKRRIVGAIEALSAARAGGELAGVPGHLERVTVKDAAGIVPRGEVEPERPRGWWARDILASYPLAALMTARRRDLEPHELEVREMLEVRDEARQDGDHATAELSDGRVNHRRELIREAYGPGSRSLARAKSRTPKRRRHRKPRNPVKMPAPTPTERAGDARKVAAGDRGA